MMQLRTRLALGATLATLAALAGGPPAQAQPTVCGTRIFRAIDRSVQANPRGFALLLSFGYRVAPRSTLAEFDTLAQCDPSGALAVFTQFQALNPNQAAAFQAAFAQDYPVVAENLFGYVPLA